MSKLLSYSKEAEAMGFVAEVHAPTVTLPRIKALTTGSIPGFVDVILNFGSKELGKRAITPVIWGKIISTLIDVLL